MNKQFALVPLGILLLGSLSAIADPPMAPVPNPGRWTIRLEKPVAAPEKEAPRTEVSREIWVLGTNRYEVTTWSDGTQGQLFINNTVGFEKSATTGDVYVLDSNIGSPAPPAVASWREFLWLKPELMTGKAAYATRPCLVYEEKTEGQIRRAMIDEETGLPVALLEGGKTYVYEFQKAPNKLPGIDAVIGGARQGYEAASKKLSVDLKPR